MRNGKSALGFVPLNELLREQLREAILAGEFPPGTTLRQEDLATRFGVSRMPIRDALRSLEVEGLIEIHPTRGASIPSLDMDEFVELYRMRERLDSLAALEAARHMNEECLDRLRSLEATLEKRSATGNLAGWLDADREFHLTSYEPSGMPRLLEVVRGLWYATQAYRRAYVHGTGHTARAEANHRALLRAFAERDAAEAERLMAEHIRETVDGVLARRDELTGSRAQTGE